MVAQRKSWAGRPAIPQFTGPEQAAMPATSSRSPSSDRRRLCAVYPCVQPGWSALCSPVALCVSPVLRGAVQGRVGEQRWRGRVATANCWLRSGGSNALRRRVPPLHEWLPRGGTRRGRGTERLLPQTLTRAGCYTRLLHCSVSMQCYTRTLL